VDSSRRQEAAAHQLRVAQNLFEKAVRECRDAGFEEDEIALIARITRDDVKRLLNEPRTL
jgi:hypothetical protein